MTKPEPQATFSENFVKFGRVIREMCSQTYTHTLRHSGPLPAHTHTHTTVLRLCGICPGKPG